jgi:hypothetical protein
MLAGLTSLVVAVVAFRRSRDGSAVQVESEHGDVTGEVTGAEVRRIRKGTLIGKIKTGDVQEGGSVTGLRIDDIGGSDDVGR